MSRARDTGEAVLSGKVTLVQEGTGPVQPGFLLYVPLYRRGMARDTPEQRRQALARMHEALARIAARVPRACRFQPLPPFAQRTAQGTFQPRPQADEPRAREREPAHQPRLVHHEVIGVEADAEIEPISQAHQESQLNQRETEHHHLAALQRTRIHRSQSTNHLEAKE